ncbi:MAG: SDR family oxidoreductase [Treponema sp.]|jgi:NAD(P)-dependent dehydrogenase (short-subunit alcohol dehydrogenase family)|nr:SDR family oxidoreductase [Treponema sp.]
MKNKFQGKVAVITGSSRGIGKAIAIELAKQGVSIVLNGRNKERLKETEAIIQKIHPNVIAFCCDVSETDASNQLIQTAIDRFGKLDFLINNVGVSMRGALAELNPVVFQKVFESNVYGTVNPTIPAIPYLRKTKGSIVFISSLAGIRGLPGLSAYCSSKMALRAIAESIRIEEKKHDIHVGLILVGITEIEHNKETISADGSMKILNARDKSKVQTTEQVALATLKNIKKRTFITTLTGIGKLNKFMQARFPMLVEKIILNNLHKFDEKSK